MFELFALLFGGSYVGHKISSEKIAHRESDEVSFKRNEIRKGLRNYRYENQLRDTVERGSAQQKKELILEVGEELSAILGGEYMKEFEDYRKNTYVGESEIAGFSSIWEVVIQLRLSKAGYVGCERYNFRRVMFGYEQFASQYISTQAALLIEDNLIQSHPELPAEYLQFFINPLDASGVEARLGYEFIGSGISPKRAFVYS